jgi:hypothetical protein
MEEFNKQLHRENRTAEVVKFETCLKVRIHIMDDAGHVIKRMTKHLLQKSDTCLLCGKKITVPNGGKKCNG